MAFLPLSSRNSWQFLLPLLRLAVLLRRLLLQLKDNLLPTARPSRRLRFLFRRSEFPNSQKDWGRLLKRRRPDLISSKSGGLRHPRSDKLFSLQ